MEITRTTIELPTGGHKRLKVLAATMGVGMGMAVDAAVREGLQKRGIPLDRLTTADDPALAEPDPRAARAARRRKAS